MSDRFVVHLVDRIRFFISYISARGWRIPPLTTSSCIRMRGMGNIPSYNLFLYTREGIGDTPLTTSSHIRVRSWGVPLFRFTSRIKRGWWVPPPSVSLLRHASCIKREWRIPLFPYPSLIGRYFPLYIFFLGSAQETPCQL